VILVTGAGGQVGSAVLAELRAAGQQVRGVYHSPAKAEPARAAGQDAVTADFSEPGTLPAAFTGGRAMFLLGAMSQQQTVHELNAVGAAQAVGITRIVKLSVWRAPDELTPVARLHRPVEQALEASGLGWTFLRPNFYMQNFLRQAAQITAGSFSQPASSAPISFADVRDVARVAAHVLTSPGHGGAIYDITGPEALSYDQAAGIFARVLGRPVRFTGLTDEEARAGMLRGGLPSFYVDSLLEVSRAYRDGGAETVTSTVLDLTGRSPVSFEQFVRDHRAVFA
jgi:uncharacterized protein YbjT (DUF2867 family)